jgi:alkylation response protein AidB-like acyl-CoA dehydrogenase
MKIELSEVQKENQLTFRRFAQEHIAPFAAEHDRTQRVSSELLRKIANDGYLGSFLPRELGGRGLDMISYGLLHEEFGKGCSSTRCLLTVHDMVTLAIQRWGSEAQRAAWLPRLARGEIIGAFAVSEPNIGSDANGVESTAVLSEDTFILNGAKKWITFGQVADVFLVLAKSAGKATALLVERDRPGVAVSPIQGMLGMRGAMLAEVTFTDCRVPRRNLVAREGFGLSSVIFTALGLGRYTIAWGSVAIAQACLEACLRYCSARTQFKALLREHQLIQKMLSEMTANTAAARLLCYQAGYLRDVGDPRELMATFVAKYFASTIAMKAALDAVQIHGANGCSSDYSVERHLRDAKIMEIIEGSTQIQEIAISRFGFQEFERQIPEEERSRQSAVVSI